MSTGAETTNTSSSLRGLFFRGGAWSLLLNAAAVILAFGLQLLLARALGAAGFGSYSYFLSILTVASVFAAYGLDSWLIRLVPALIERGELGQLKARYVAASGRVLLLAIVTAVLLGFSYWQRFEALALAAGLIFFLLWTQNIIRQSVLRGLHRPVAARVPDVIVRPLIVAGCVLGAVIYLRGGLRFLWTDNTVEPLPLWVPWFGQSLGALAAFVVGGVVLRRVWRSAATPEAAADRSFPGASVLLGYSLVVAAIGEVDRIILGTISSPEQVGVYGASLRIAAFVSFVLDAMAISFAPLLSTAFARRDVTQTQRLLNTIHRYVAALTIPLVILLLLAREPILALFGREFSGEPQVLAILVLGQLGLVFFGTAGYALTMGEREREALVISGCMLAAAVLLLPVLASAGLVSFACGVAALQWLRGLLFCAAAKARLRINCSLLSWLIKPAT